MNELIQDRKKYKLEDPDRFVSLAFLPYDVQNYPLFTLNCAKLQNLSAKKCCYV